MLFAVDRFCYKILSHRLRARKLGLIKVELIILEGLNWDLNPFSHDVSSLKTPCLLLHRVAAKIFCYFVTTGPLGLESGPLKSKISSDSNVERT